MVLTFPGAMFGTVTGSLGLARIASYSGEFMLRIYGRSFGCCGFWSL